MSEHDSDAGERKDSAAVTASPLPPDLRKRRRVGLVLVVIAAAIAMFVSGWGMWHFFDDLPGLDDWYMILPMFLLFDIAAVACAVNARVNRVAYKRMGIEGWLVWAFAGLSGAMSASDAQGRAATAVRFAAPLVAAVLFELLIRGESRDLKGGDGPIARVTRRIKARLGLLESLGESDQEAAKRVAAGRLATLAYRMHQIDVTKHPRGRRRAAAKFHRRLRAATERLQFASDTEMINAVRVHLAALYQSVSGTSETAVADLNLWKAADHLPTVPTEHASAEQTEQTEQTDTGQVDSVPAPGQVDMWADLPAEQVDMAPAALPADVPAEPVRPAVLLPEPAVTEAVTLPQPTPERVDVAPDTRPVSGAGGTRPTREQALEQFGDQLVEEWLAAGEDGITEYRVRTVCGLSARPAAAVHREIRARAEAALRADEESHAGANGHALRADWPELIDQR